MLFPYVYRHLSFYPSQDSVPESTLKREQRAIALTAAKQSIKAFDPQVRQNRRSIQIDLVQEETASRGTTAITSTTGLVCSTDARTDFEREFRQAIEDSGMNWNDNTSSQLPPSAPIQIDRERRQMARVRTLVRAEQIKARRLKKIKSKSYRKLLRKTEMQGMQELLAKLDKEDPQAAEQVKADLEKKLSSLRLNRQRQARIKWAKAAERFGGREMRSEISKQAQAETDDRRELLRAIKGKEQAGSDSDDSSDSDSDGGSGSEKDEGDIVAQIKRKINSKVLSGSDNALGDPEKGLLGMKFMRDAATRQHKETVDEAKKFVETLEREDDESSSSSICEQNQQDLVASLFSVPVEEPVSKPKSTSFKLEKPQDDADVVPGWGSWVGEGVKQRSNKRKRPEVPAAQAKPSAVMHLLSEEAIRAPLMKYQIAEVPYPYTSKAEYEAATATPIGPEWMSMSAHAEKIQPKVCLRIGAVVPPIKLAKHLDADKRGKLIDAWDNRKRIKHTKARFL